MKAALIMPGLLLQYPHDTSTTKENVSCLDRRLQLWSEGSIANLLSEGKLIQSRLRRFSPNSGSHNDDHHATVFANLVMQGKISDAIRYLDSSSKGGILHPNDSCGQDGLSVLDCLRSKHPSKAHFKPSISI